MTRKKYVKAVHSLHQRWCENCGKVTTKSLIQFKKLLINTDTVLQYVDKLNHITAEKMDFDNFSHREILAFARPDRLSNVIKVNCKRRFISQ